MENNTNPIHLQKNNLLSTPYRNSRKQGLIAVFWLICIVLGAWQAWNARHHMDADGISYLDIGDAYFRGDWKMAINAYWSPLYSWLLGLAIHLLKPSPYNEFPVVHLVNFIIYLLTLGCFHFFLMQLIRYHQFRYDKTSGNCDVSFPEWAWIALGYSLFLHSSLNMMSLSDVTPDMCVAAFVYLASGMLLRIRRGKINYLAFAFLGVVLGFAYLAKAVMFPLAFVFLMLSVFSIGNLRKALSRTIIALIIFLSVTSPFIIAISYAKGRFTFGESGKYNYWVHVNFKKPTHWTGAPPGSGTPSHPPRLIFNVPKIYEFGTPIGGTYPLWYDPSYWYDGIKFTFYPEKQLQATKTVIKMYYEIFYHQYRVLIFGSIIFYLMGRRRWLLVKDIAEHWTLFVPAFSALGIYCLVAADYRYVGPFIVLLWLGVFSSIRLPDSKESERLLRYIVIIIVLVTMISTTRHLTADENPSTDMHWQVANLLTQLGVSPGDKVASIGHSHAHFWARLAKVRIVAEIPSEEAFNFWKANSETQLKVVETFGRTGAKAIITNIMPDDISPIDWQKIGNSNYYIYKIPPADPVSPAPPKPFY
jgi:hypothetical protein